MKDEAEINAVPQANMDHETQAADTGDEDQDLFEQLLSEYDYRAPRRGQILSGQIIRIAEDAILVDIGLKRDAVVPSREISLLDEEYLQKLQVGDEVVVYVLRPPAGDHDLLVSLSKGLEHESWSRAETYLEAGMILELEVSGFNKGGVLVDFENLRGFVPASQIPELRHAGDRQRLQQVKQNLVGTQMAVKVIEVDRQRNRLVFSALAAEEERRKKRLQELEPGQIVLRAKVASVVDFGIFVDLDGVDGLVHVSQLDWKMVKHPSDHFKPGDEVDVQIIAVDVERERISLSRKALLPNPWESLMEKYRPGDVIQGTVTRVLDFGAFVRVDEGIEGLVHVSEIGYSGAGKPQELVKAGDQILVRILDLNPEKERLSLSMRRVPLNKQIAWMAEELGEVEEPPEEESQPDAPPEQEADAG